LRVEAEERLAAEPLVSAPVTEAPLTAADLIGASTPGELDLFPLLMLMRSHLWRTILCAFLGLLLAGFYTYTRKPRYASTASILIPQQNNPSAASAALQAATGLDLLGGGYEVYIDILKSHAVEDKLIQQYNLEQHYKVFDLAGAEGILFSRTSMFAGKEGMVWVTVQDEDPKMAADLANSYFAELSQLNARLGISAAAQLRRYYEAEMVKEKDALGDAEVALEQSQEKNGLLEPQTQASAALNAEENTRAQLRARQVELQALLQGATAQNPDVVRLQAQIAGLEGQLRAEESTGGPDVGTPQSKEPQQALDYIRKQREVKFHEALLDMLTRNYESARQQESKDISMVELLDTARPSHFKEWPPKKLWLVTGFAVGLAFGILWTALEAFYSVLTHNPRNRARFDALARGKVAGSAIL
jgi:tyrosine-protein kinase Etk/Wzc